MHYSISHKRHFSKNYSVKQCIEYAGNNSALGYLQKFLITKPPRIGYRSFETWLLHQIRNRQPLLECMDTRKHWKVQVNISYSPGWLTHGSLAPLQNTDSARTVEWWSCFKKCILWTIWFPSKRTDGIHWLIIFVEVPFELFGCVNKQN